MGAIADSLFSALMSWVRALVNDLWAIFSSERTTILEFLGKNWIMIVIVMLAIGLTVDWLIWLVRWQPYHLWAQRMRRFLRIDSPEDEEEGPAHAARMPERPRDQAAKPAPQPVRQGEGGWPESPVTANEWTDEQRTAYPGMRYDSRESMERITSGETQRFSAVHSEGPGAAEVARRRAEIDAWQLQMQEEARAKANAEAEQARLAREEAARAEQARLAREEAARAEQARLAQEKYERDMAEYRRQKAQYALDMAEYQRQKAAYDAQMAQLARRNVSRQPVQVQPQQNAQYGGAADMTQSTAHRRAFKPANAPETASPVQTSSQTNSMRSGGLREQATKLAWMIEPEQSEVSGITTLPPPVDMHDAYAPAAMPQRPDRFKK